MIVKRSYSFNLLWFLVGLSCLGRLSAANNLLPDGFTMEFDETTGWELRWKSLKGNRVQVGGARPEFRLEDLDDGGSSSVVLGYPLETSDGGLRLPVSASQQKQLSNNGANLQVWSSGQRLDKIVENVFASKARKYDSSAPVTPVVDINPAAKGNYITSRLWYNLSALGNVTDFPVPIEVVAEVTRPVLKSGKSPIVLFLHGRHSTCYDPSSSDMSTGDWPCSSGYKPIPGHKGYRYVADILASQGYVTVSIAANGVNGQDGNVADSGASARSILIRHHLVQWAKWNRGTVKDPWGGIFKGKVDLTKVVLVGHSRGGEGVNRAAVDASNADPFKIVGIVSYGPTAFGRQVTPDIHSATILPTCDGDVSDLQGQAYIDESRDIAYSNALRTAVISIGTNHNYYNTEWTPGISVAPSNDDWYNSNDPVCGDQVPGSLRLTPKEQQAVGAAYTCALVRFAVEQDQEMLQFLDGSFVKPKSIGRAEVVTQAVGGASYRLLYRPQNDNDTKTIVRLQNGMKGNVCKGYSSSFFDTRTKDTPNCGGDYSYPSPHWLTMSGAETRPAPRALELRWENRNGATSLSFPSVNLNAFDSINIRIANDPNEEPAQFELWISDSSGNNSTLTTSLTSIDGWPGTDSIDRVHARTFRGDIVTAKKQVNLKSVVGVVLVALSQTGRVWVLDVAVSRSIVSKPIALNLPVLSVANNINVPEGDGPRRTYVPVIADRELSSPASVWVQKGNGENYTLNMPAGSRVARIPFSWAGDNFYGTSDSYNNFVLAPLSGVLTGNYMGKVTIVEDDPVPTLSTVKATATAVKGKNLEWILLLSGPTAGVTYYFVFVSPLSGSELTTADVDPNWLSQYVWSPPNRAVPLSKMLVSVGVEFPANVTNTTLSIPLANDFVSPKSKCVRFELRAFDNPTVANRIVLNGIARNTK